jgi:hypothetical protein
MPNFRLPKAEGHQMQRSDKAKAFAGAHDLALNPYRTHWRPASEIKSRCGAAPFNGVLRKASGAPIRWDTA